MRGFVCEREIARASEVPPSLTHHITGITLDRSYNSLQLKRRLFLDQSFAHTITRTWQSVEGHYPRIAWNEFRDAG